MEETILRSKAMQIIDSGELFDIGFVTADRRRGTGGEYIQLKQWCKVKQDTPNQEVLPQDIRPPKKDLARDPNHRANKTFNIWNPRHSSAHIHKVHYRLFDRFNGKRVLQ